MTDDSPALDVLDSRECYRLLSTQTLGRLGVLIDRYPAVYPVNYAIDDGIIVLRSMAGTKSTALEHANVTFLVDSIDLDNHTGWSVLVRGQAEHVGPHHSPTIAERTRAAGVKPWVQGNDFRWVRIIPHAISGRRLRLDDTELWSLGTAAYM